MNRLTGPKRTALIAIPPSLGMVASIWPLDRILLVLVCVSLVVLSLTTILFARSTRHLLLNVGAIALLLSTIMFNMPLQMVFRSCRPQFDRIADELAAGTAVQTPLWIGPIRVCKAELDANGIVCLWTDDTPAGRTGFVRHGASELPFNLWSHSVMDDAWQFIRED